MKTRLHLIMGVLGLGLLWGTSSYAQTFNSGSTGADGAFNPPVNTTLQLPPNGVFNFTTVDIPTGITVKFLRNSNNTPVTILATGNVTIAGTLEVSGASAAASGASGDGNLGDDGQPGLGGPGGFNGGFGGIATAAGSHGGTGLGPGGGGPGLGLLANGSPCGGSGGGFSVAGGVSAIGCAVTAGPTYGTVASLPLIGGSGGGGGSGGTNFAGSGGGGGGGAILIASSGTISVTGSILANGGSGGTNAGTGQGACGGGGSGGAIRLLANAIGGNGTISANGAAAFSCVFTAAASGAGSVGRIRLEANSITRTAATTPPYTFSSPGNVFVTGNPTLQITSVAGVAAPANPTGSADITLPSSISNPVTVTLAASGIPIGTAITVFVTPVASNRSSVTSTALTGTTAASTASASITLNSGPSVISASATFTITQTAALDFPVFADGERVEKVRVAAALGGKSSVTYITASGREIPAESLR